MSLLCDYFVATSAEAAAATIDVVGGPSQDTSRRVGHDVIELPGIEPVVLMGLLEGLLTGRSFTDILGDEGHDHVAIRDGGEQLVIPIGVAMEQALRGLNDDALPEVATAWSEVEEFGGSVGPGQLADVIRQLVKLARHAHTVDGHVYCWLCV